MADIDYNSSLPVRSEADGIDARVQVKIVDKTAPGTQQMTVDTDSNAHVEMHGNDPAGVDRVARTSEAGELANNGLYNAATNTKPSHNGLILQQRNAASADSRQIMQPTAVRGTVDTTKVAIDVSMNDENGNAYTTLNPMPVVLSDEEIGTAVHDFQIDASPTGIAAAGTGTITYTVPAASILSLKRIVMSGSGRFKAEVFLGVASGTPRKYVLFNSTAQPNLPFDVPKNFRLNATEVVKVTFTNLDKQPFNVFLTVEGTINA